MSVLTCPVCTATMREQERGGVTIDVCSQCRGVWLDRGELEKLSTALTQPADSRAVAYDPRDDARAGPRQQHGRFDDDDDDDDDRRGIGSAGRKRGRMGGLLDFFD